MVDSPCHVVFYKNMKHHFSAKSKKIKIPHLNRKMTFLHFYKITKSSKNHEIIFVCYLGHKESLVKI